jgi:hypothetical protein
LDSQLYGRGGFAVQFQSDKWNPADFSEVWLWEITPMQLAGDSGRMTS